MIKRIDRKALRIKKHKSIRKNVTGAAERPRLAVFRSLNHIYAQVINDELGVTIVAASSLDPEFKAADSSGGNAAGAQSWRIGGEESPRKRNYESCLRSWREYLSRPNLSVGEISTRSWAQLLTLGKGGKNKIG